MKYGKTSSSCQDSVAEHAVIMVSSGPFESTHRETATSCNRISKSSYAEIIV